MRTDTLKWALKPIHRQAGLKLSHPRPHLLCLETRHGSPIAYFDVKAPIEKIHDAADTWIKETDAQVDVARNFLFQEHPFLDKTLTMENFLEYLTGEKRFMKCPKCSKEVRIRPYGEGYVAWCCNEIIYNSKKLPEAIK